MTKEKGSLIWVDILCFSSIPTIIKHQKGYDALYYANVSVFFLPFVGIFRWIFQVELRQISNFAETEHMVNGSNVYEEVQRRVTSCLEGHQFDFPKGINVDLDRDIFREYMKDVSYPLVFRPVELSVLIDAIGSPDRDLLLLKSHAMRGMIEKTFSVKVFFYHCADFFGNGILRREGYIYDGLNTSYFSPKNNISLKVIFSWFLSLIFSFYPQKKYNKTKTDGINIGADLFQPQFRKNGCNDLFWIEGLSFKKQEKCISFAYEAYDKNSLKELDNAGVRLVITAERFFSNPIYYFKNQKSYTVGKPSFDYFSNTMLDVVLIFYLLFVPGYKSWTQFHSAIYILRSKYWSNIYRKFNIQLLWSMADAEKDKVTKAQALRWNGGIYLGSHWSNFPVYQSNTEKCYDIFFVWSRHFIDNIFSRYHYKAALEVGYPSDHSFSKNREFSDKLRSSFGEKFIISFHDNVVLNDLPHSKSMWLDVYQALENVLNKYRNTVVLIKPKRGRDVERILSNIESAQVLISSKRLVVIGDKYTTLPSEVGMASDLVVGLGVSSAAAECCFSGVVSFYADFAKFNNAFTQKSVGQIVFHDKYSLEKAIEKQINGAGISILECQHLHRELDKFQDGQAYLRVGGIIEQLREAYNSNDNLDDVISDIKNTRRSINLSKY